GPLGGVLDVGTDVCFLGRAIEEGFVIHALSRPEQADTPYVIVLALNADEGVGIERAQASFEGMAGMGTEDRPVVCLTELIGALRVVEEKREVVPHHQRIANRIGIEAAHAILA